ncbi:MAG: V4R domain-containing protein [Candidatus Diapherotrites archaeon]
MKELVLKFDEKKGEVQFEQYSSEIHSRGMIAEIQRKFHTVVGEMAEMLIYSAAKDYSIKTVEKYELLFVAFTMVSKRLFAEQLMKQLPKRGYGVGEIIHWDEQKKQLAITVKNCFNAVGFPPGKKPVCFAMAGILAGAAQTIFRTDMQCLETKCVAKGDEICEFRMGTKTERTYSQK